MCKAVSGSAHNIIAICMMHIVLWQKYPLCQERSVEPLPPPFIKSIHPKKVVVVSNKA